MYLNELMPTEDAVEGLQAFLEKRDPVWRHR
jgi:1,4-dihydroxy-2-naphthoyl-CoA synthase